MLPLKGKILERLYLLFSWEEGVPETNRVIPKISYNVAENN